MEKISSTGCQTVPLIWSSAELVNDFSRAQKRVQIAAAIQNGLFLIIKCVHQIKPVGICVKQLDLKVQAETAMEF